MAMLGHIRDVRGYGFWEAWLRNAGADVIFFPRFPVRVHRSRLLAALLAVFSVTAHAQDTQPAVPSSDRALERARTIIMDSNASPEVRRIGAEELLENRTPQALALMIDMLRANGDAGRAVAVCGAITAVGARQPELLNEQLVSPLLDLLGHDHPGIRAAAAMALAGFPGSDVSDQLRQLAADAERSLQHRMAAVDSLTPNVSQRHVIAQLILLLDLESEPMRGRVLAALRSASSADYGTDAEAWKNWWKSKETLSDTQWLTDRVDLFRRENRWLQDEMTQIRTDYARKADALSRRLREQIELSYRLTREPENRDLLLKWLKDDLVEYRMAAVALIASEIADGHLPDGEVRTALHDRFTDDSPVVRRLVFDVVAALADPSDYEFVVKRLGEEKQPQVRTSILRALGRLRNSAAIEPLAATLADTESSEGEVTEAAVSLGLLGARGAAESAEVAPAVEALRNRFEGTPREKVQLRAALLGAMASIAASEFPEEFLLNLDEDDPELLLPALAGVKAVGRADRMERILALISSSDARVRRRAIEAIAALGGDVAHIEALASRLRTEVEPNEGVRQAAWLGFQALVTTQPSAIRLDWAIRLVDQPKHQEQLLGLLIAEFEDAGVQPPEILQARQHLAALFEGQGRQIEAVPVRRRIWQTLAESNSEQAAQAGLDYLGDCLVVGHYEVLGELIQSLVAGKAQSTIDAVEQQLVSHFDVLQSENSTDRLNRFVEQLDQIDAAMDSDRLREAIRHAQTQLAAPDAPESAARMGSQ